MKRTWLIAVIAVILLAGCADNTAQETTQVTLATTLPTEDPSWYVEGSAMEQKTQSAIQTYALDGTYTDISTVGDNILLADHYGATYLAALDAETGKFAGGVRVGKNIPLGAGGLQRTYNGIGYYQQEKNQAVIFNAQLQEIQRIDLPADMVGGPVFSESGSELFYCVGNEIKALDIDLGITRLVKTLTYQEHILVGCYFGGKLLACEVTDQLGENYTIYISGETGQTLAQDDGLHTVYSSDDSYLGLRTDGIVAQYIIGQYNETAKQMHLASEECVFSAVEMDSVVGFLVNQDGAMNISLYDISSNKKTATITVNGLDSPIAACSDKTAVWFLAVDKETQAQTLYKWNPEMNAISDEEVYTSAVYTKDAPDSAGLEQCKSRADKLGGAHSVDIRIWERAVRNPGEYTLEAEYQTDAINACLDQLEEVLKLFPENFLYKSVKNQVRICIVRSISNGLDGVQYWHNGDAFIVLTPGADVCTELIRGMGYVVNSHTVGNSPLTDSWNLLNPEGFVYGEVNESYLHDGSRAFADAESMQSVTEDKSRLFFYAITEGNEEIFQSEIMQQKLLMLCKGIRDAWRWEKKMDIYPWEQYLKESIAYKK